MRKTTRRSTAKRRRISKPGKADRQQAMNIRAQLLQRGYTLKAVGDIASVSRKHVSNVVAGIWKSEHVWQVINRLLRD